MSLRRFAHTNHAGAQATSPRGSDSLAGSSPSTPMKVKGTPPTPRTRLIYPHSPLTSPSLSASTPFDWEAARARKPPPYASPLAGRRAKTMHPPASKKVIRKKGTIEKITSFPQYIAFQVSQFPNNVPMPSARNTAWIVGGSMHFVHFCARIAMLRRIPVSELGWEDLYREDEQSSWFDWPFVFSTILIIVAILNTFRLFTRTRMYQLNLAKDPVASPHAKFVRRESKETVPVRSRPTVFSILWTVIKHLWRGLMLSARFILNMSPPKDREAASTTRYERVQQLEVWTPGDFEMMLFAVYSPVHACLWMAFNDSNWILMSFLMLVVGMQARALTRSFEALLKDRAIISAEVMHEYDEKFVYPRVNPIRKDAAVMTHEAEMVDVWSR